MTDAHFRPYAVRRWNATQGKRRRARDGRRFGRVCPVFCQPQMFASVAAGALRARRGCEGVSAILRRRSPAATRRARPQASVPRHCPRPQDAVPRSIADMPAGRRLASGRLRTRHAHRARQHSNFGMTEQKEATPHRTPNRPPCRSTRPARPASPRESANALSPGPPTSGPGALTLRARIPGLRMRHGCTDRSSTISQCCQCRPNLRCPKYIRKSPWR